ncbi:MAG: ankyrin repeat domain-containing protein [Spirochaetales bacterium]|nr:ankyrin repeat domain-containing protein [Spirochaetales bacterium]
MNLRKIIRVPFFISIILCAITCEHSQEEKFFTDIENNSFTIVNDCLKEGINPNITDEKGWTALMNASALGHMDIVNLLLASGADIEYTDLQGLTAYILAVENKHEEICTRLIEEYEGYILGSHSKWISAASGLKLRERPSLHAATITIIPFLEEVAIIKQPDITIKIGEDTGNWTYISWENKKGWVFDAFLEINKSLAVKKGYGYGIISGVVGYPSEVVPDMLVWAKNIDTGNMYKTSTDTSDDYVSYEIIVPPGRYVVFTYPKEDENYENKIIGCYTRWNGELWDENHDFIIIKIETEQESKNIDPTDWNIEIHTIEELDTLIPEE